MNTTLRALAFRADVAPDFGCFYAKTATNLLFPLSEIKGGIRQRSIMNCQTSRPTSTVGPTAPAGSVTYGCWPVAAAGKDRLETAQGYSVWHNNGVLGQGLPPRPNPELTTALPNNGANGISYMYTTLPVHSLLDPAMGQPSHIPLQHVERGVRDTGVNGTRSWFPCWGLAIPPGFLPVPCQKGLRSGPAWRFWSELRLDVLS